MVLHYAEVVSVLAVLFQAERVVPRRFRTPVCVRIGKLVDIHSHILPGLDDGAESLDDALSMVKMAAEAGTTDIVASPHANDRYAYHPETVHAKVAELQQACVAG